VTDPDREHTTEPAEGGDPPGTASTEGRTPHPEEPAEGKQTGDPGADAPDA
jgi:hypothetical protein